MRSAFVLALASLLMTQGAKPDFSGKWVLDKERSFSNPPELDQSIEVVHKGDEVLLEAVLTTPAQGRQVVREQWALDGTERDFTPPTPPNAKGKRKAYWLPGNRGIVVEDRVTAETPGAGAALLQTTRKWTLTADGATLTVDYYIDRPTGSGESRRVFVKEAAGGRGRLDPAPK